MRRHIGYRGAALIIFGLMYIGIGVGTTYSAVKDPHIWYTTWPMWLRVTEWCSTGGFAILAAATGVGSLKTAAFVGLYIGPVLRACSLIVAVAIHFEVQLLTGVFVWLLLTGLVVLISAWPEPIMVMVTNNGLHDVPTVDSR